MHELIDIGVNLTHRSFARDRSAVIDRARAAGVGTLILTGTSVAHSREALALELDKPLFLHERDAHQAFVAILDRAMVGGGLKVPVVVHCFTGSGSSLEAYLRRGLDGGRHRARTHARARGPARAGSFCSVPRSGGGGSGSPGGAVPAADDGTEQI